MIIYKQDKPILYDDFTIKCDEGRAYSYPAYYISREGNKKSPYDRSVPEYLWHDHSISTACYANNHFQEGWYKTYEEAESVLCDYLQKVEKGLYNED